MFYVWVQFMYFSCIESMYYVCAESMYYVCAESMYYFCAESMYYVCGGSTELDGNLAPNDTCDAYRIVDVENRLEIFSTSFS